MARKTACAVHQATVERQAEQVKELEAALKETNARNENLHATNKTLRSEVLSMQAAKVRAEFRHSLAIRERDALRKVVVVLIETGRFSDPNQVSANTIAATFSPDTKHWSLAQSPDSESVL